MNSFCAPALHLTDCSGDGPSGLLTDTDLFRKLHWSWMCVLRCIGEVGSILHGILGVKEQDVTICCPFCTWDYKAEPVLQQTCPQALLTTVWGSGWVREMFRVSESLRKPPAHLLAHPFLQSVLVKHLHIWVWRGRSPQYCRSDKASRFSERNYVGYRPV